MTTPNKLQQMGRLLVFLFTLLATALMVCWLSLNVFIAIIIYCSSTIVFSESFSIKRKPDVQDNLSN